MTEPQAPSPPTGRGSPLSLLVTLALLVGLTLYLFQLPLRPTAWGGPSDTGPFEDGRLPASGWFGRDARLYLARLAEFRSPDRRLEATAEALAGYYALLALTRYGLLWVVLRRVGGSGLLASLGVVAAVLPVMFGAPRQYGADFGLLLFVALLMATTPVRTSWRVTCGVLPALFAVWANAHTSVLVGLAWLGVITLGRLVEWWRARRRGEYDEAWWARLLLGLGLCAVAACLNPDGPRIYVDAITSAKNPNMSYLADWQPVDFSKPAGMPWGYFATLAALLVAQLVSPRVFSATALLVILTFGFWPLVQQRGLGYWWLIAPWLVVPMLTPVVQTLKRRLNSAETDAPSEGDAGQVGKPVLREGRTRLTIAHRIALFVVAFTLLWTPFARWGVSGRPRDLGDIVSNDTPWHVARELTADGNDVGKYSPELRDTVRTAYPSGRYRGAILCDAEQGDFLAWVLDGDNSQPVMLYTRPETFDPPHWAEAHRALEGPGDWWEILGRHQVNLVVIDPGKRAKLAERLRGSQAWRTFQDGTLLVAVRREPKLPAEMQRP
jgi:hypothetical protein